VQYVTNIIYLKKDIDVNICNDCILYKHNCYKCGEEYENKIKNPSNKLCNDCINKNNEIIKRLIREENEKKIQRNNEQRQQLLQERQRCCDGEEREEAEGKDIMRNRQVCPLLLAEKINYKRRENELWNTRDYFRLSAFDKYDVIDIDGIRFSRNMYSNEHDCLLKTYETNNIIIANYQLNKWINEQYKTINPRDYVYNTFKVDIQIIITNKYLNSYGSHTIKLHIEEIDVTYE
jgi:hypothetical protein